MSKRNNFPGKSFRQYNSNSSLPDDFDLSDEFITGFNAIEKTSRHLYVTGEAGTGKTTFLQYVRKKTKKQYIVLAPTGIAAINSHGQTIHSFFQFPPKLIQKEDIRRVYNGQKVFKPLELLIIDEASMVRADLFDAIDYSLRLNRGIYDIPFGGVQLVLIGDLYQLPPIVDREMKRVYSKLYETPYFFSANVFQEITFHQLNFQKIYRQRDSKFKGLLNKLRNQELNASDMQILNSRVELEFNETNDDYITLTPTNNAANAINEARLSRLEGKEFVYKAKIGGKFDRSSYPTEIGLCLKVGAQVLMIRNNPDKWWVNGSIGEVVKLKKNLIKVRIESEVYEVTPQIWEKIRYKYDDKEKKIIEEVVGSFKQYPMKLAWAITIHKSQGLTLDKLIIDLDHGAFTHGQVYVALSRCPSFDNIVLRRPITYRDIIFDDRIHFIKDRFPKLKG